MVLDLDMPENVKEAVMETRREICNACGLVMFEELAPVLVSLAVSQADIPETESFDESDEDCVSQQSEYSAKPSESRTHATLTCYITTGNCNRRGKVDVSHQKECALVDGRIWRKMEFEKSLKNTQEIHS